MDSAAWAYVIAHRNCPKWVTSRCRRAALPPPSSSSAPSGADHARASCPATSAASTAPPMQPSNAHCVAGRWPAACGGSTRRTAVDWTGARCRRRCGPDGQRGALASVRGPRSASGARAPAQSMRQGKWLAQCMPRMCGSARWWRWPAGSWQPTMGLSAVRRACVQACRRARMQLLQSCLRAHYSRAF